MTTLARRNSSIHKIREHTLPKVTLEDDYEVVHVMQEGWRGRLLLVEHKRTRHEVVLKAIHKETTSKLEFFREFHYNYYLSPHTNILNAYDVAFQAGEYYVFAQEYAPFGDLTSNLCETGLGEGNVKKIAPQLVSALEFMHSKDLVHRNLNMDNVLVFNIDFSEVKLCDFGSTRKNGSLMKRKTVSLPYAPPEIVDTVQNEGFHVNTKQDVWQFGILMYILLTGALPWQKADVSDPHYLEYIHWKKRKTLKTPKRFSNFTARALRMFKRLLEPKPDKRSSIPEVYKYLEDKWLVRPMKRQEADVDNQSVCYSTFSIHSSKIEKDKVLHTLKAHGIETTVDRIAKRKRIHEWIEKSLNNNLMFDENENNNEINNTSGVKTSLSDTHIFSSRTATFFPEPINISLQDRIKTDRARNNSPTVRNQENAPTIMDRNSFPNRPISGSSAKPSKLTEEILKSSHGNFKELFSSMKPSQPVVRSSAEVKRTSSFQEKSNRQLSVAAETPCNNYKEMHSSRSHYHQSPSRNPLSPLRVHSKSQRLFLRTTSNAKTSLNPDDDEAVPQRATDRSRQTRKSPPLRRSKGKSLGAYQRSRSLARNHNYEFDLPKTKPEPRPETRPEPAPEGDKSRPAQETPESEDSTSHSDDSLTSVIPVSYYL